MTGLYIGAMGMISNMIKLDVHSNNIANASTNGFKFDQETFRVLEETHLRSKKEGSSERIGTYHDEVFVDNIRTNFSVGSMTSSASPLDFALVDESPAKTSFFAIGKEGNTYLTKNGSFMLDQNRHVSTANGGQVLDTQGNPIKIPEGTSFAVNPNGSIVRGDTNEVIAKMQLYTVEQQDLGLLKKEYGGYYSIQTAAEIEKNFGPMQGIINEFNGDATLRKVFGTVERLVSIRDTGEVSILQSFDASGGRVVSNALETSNVDMSKEMVGIINAQKGVQAAQKVFTTMDNILEKAANELAK